MNLFRALRHRPFALLWSAQIVSVLGDRVFQVALAWWVLQKTGSGAAMATVLILTIAPMLVLLLLGGVITDRFNRFALMLFSDVLRGIIIALAAGLAYLDALTIEHVYLFSLVFGTVDAFFQPAFRAVFPQVLPAEDLPSANSLASLARPVSGIIGPSLGAGVVLAGGTALAFYLDAASFALSAVCMLPLLGLTLPRIASTADNVFDDLREGIGTVLASPWLWVTIGVAGISSIAYAAPMEVALPFLIKGQWNADVGVLGGFYSAAALGSLLAAIFFGNLRRLRQRGPRLYGAWLLIGVLIIAIGLPLGGPAVLFDLPTGVLVAIASSFLIGICQTTIDLNWVNTLQEYVPPERLGRVTSVDYLGSFILLPVGYAAGGYAVDALGPSPVFILGGILLAILVGVGFLHPAVRAMD